MAKFDSLRHRHTGMTFGHVALSYDVRESVDHDESPVDESIEGEFVGAYPAARLDEMPETYTPVVP